MRESIVEELRASEAKSIPSIFAGLWITYDVAKKWCIISVMAQKRKLILLIVIIAAAAVVFVLGAFSFSPSLQPKSEAQPISALTKAVSKDVITEAATAGTIPTLGTAVNPLEEMPEVNPVEKANPFSNVYKNPFGE